MTQERYIRFGGVSVRYLLRRPAGKTVCRALLTPSPFLSAEQFGPIMEALEAQGCLCVCCDVPGFGRSVWPGEQPFDVESAAQMLWGVLDEVDRQEGGRPECWHLIFHGLSGRIAFSMARISPDSVLSLALICPCLNAPSILGRSGVSARLRRLISGRRGFSLMARLLYGRKTPEKEWGPLRRAFLRPGAAENLASFAVHGEGRESWGLFAPKLVIWSGRDAILGGHIPEKLRSALPDAEYHTIRSAGHIPMYTHARAVQDYLRGWLMANR